MSPRPAGVGVVFTVLGENKGGSCSCFTTGLFFFLDLSPQ